MSYVVQLLPDEEEARVIRDALVAFQKEGLSNDENDICWKYISQISEGQARERKRKASQ